MVGSIAVEPMVGQNTTGSVHEAKNVRRSDQNARRLRKRSDSAVLAVCPGI